MDNRATATHVGRSRPSWPATFLVCALVAAIVTSLVGGAPTSRSGPGIDDVTADPIIQEFDELGTPVFQDDMAFGELDAAIDSQVTRLYLAYFQREPADDGLAFWRDKRKAGTTIVNVADTFAESPEFQNRYGQADNVEFVSLVFNNVLGRQPKDEGLTYWAGVLDDGATRGAIMVGFSDSKEFITATGTLPPPPPPPPPPEPEPEPVVTTTVSQPTSVSTSTPVAAPQLPRGYTPTPVTYEQVRGAQALSRISYQWEDKLRGWSIHFHSPKIGFLGLTWPGDRRIDVYVRSDQSDTLLAHVVAHEIGHAIDVSLNSGSDRATWASARGISWARWWPSAAASDFSTGAGDFAEAFAFTQIGSYTYFRSNLGGAPTFYQRSLVAAMANS